MQPFGFQAKADGEHYVGIRYPGHISAPGHEGMGVAAGLQQGEYLCPVSAYHLGPVTYEVGSSNNLDGRAGGGGRGGGLAAGVAGGGRSRSGVPHCWRSGGGLWFLGLLGWLGRLGRLDLLGWLG